MKTYTSTLEMEADGLLWKNNAGKYQTHCPTCRKIRTHKNRGTAVDHVYVLCRRCHIERYGSPWQQLKLLNQTRRIEDY